MYLIFLWVSTFLLKCCYILLFLWVTSTWCQLWCQNNVKTVETVNLQACEKLKRFFFVYLNGFIAPLKEPLLFGSVIFFFFSSSQTKDLNSESNSLNLSGKMCCVSVHHIRSNLLIFWTEPSEQCVQTVLLLFLPKYALCVLLLLTVSHRHYREISFMQTLRCSLSAAVSGWWNEARQCEFFFFCPPVNGRWGKRGVPLEI